MSASPAAARKVQTAFRRGNASDVVDAFQQVNREVLDYSAEMGPLPKNVATLQMEDIYRRLVNGESFSIEDGPNDSKIIKFDDTSYDLTYSLAHMNTGHLTFSEDDLSQYERYCESKSKVKPQTPNGGYPTAEYFEEREEEALSKINEQERKKAKKEGRPFVPQTKLYQNMSYPEKLAINVYTTSYYQEMNPLLQGRYDFSKKSKADVRDAIIHTVMCGHALDKVQQVEMGATFRYQGDYNLKEQMEIIKKGGAYMTRGFISSGAKPAETFKNKVAITYQNLKGQYVAPLSRYPHEREFLIPPTQMNYSHHVKVDGTHYFLAQPVVDLAAIEKQALAMPDEEAKLNFKLSTMITELTRLKQQLESVSTPEQLSGLNQRIDALQNFVEDLSNTTLKTGRVSKVQFVEAANKIGEKLADIKEKNQQLLNRVSQQRRDRVLKALDKATKSLDEKIADFKSKGLAEKAALATSVREELAQQANKFRSNEINLDSLRENIERINQFTSDSQLSEHRGFFSKIFNSIKSAMGFSKSKTATEALVDDTVKAASLSNKDDKKVAKESKSANIDSLIDESRKIKKTQPSAAQQQFISRIEHSVKEPLQHALVFLTSDSDVLQKIEQHIEQYRNNDFMPRELIKALEKDVAELDSAGVSSDHVKHFIEVLEKLPEPAEPKQAAQEQMANVNSKDDQEEDGDSEGVTINKH